ncbi:MULTISPECIES: hypothetical protein, partial [unclassified Brevibacillus]|uniref:hypothetical protein n=1 Tax=unclassified Brevibacillus TaxID=2684853 RepID=UPI00356B15D7
NKVCYWFKAGKSFNDRLINTFAVQFSKSIFTSTSKALDSQYTMHHHFESTGIFLGVSFCSALFERRISNIT